MNGKANRSNNLHRMEVGFDITKAAKTDDVRHSLDYKTLSNRIKEYVSNNTHELIETLIQNIADNILKEFDGRICTLSIRDSKCN